MRSIEPTRTDDDAYLSAAALRRDAILETWRRKKEQVRHLTDALSALQRRAHTLSGKLDAQMVAPPHQRHPLPRASSTSNSDVTRRPGVSCSGHSPIRYTRSSPCSVGPVSLISLSPPRELTATASQALMGCDEGVGCQPTVAGNDTQRHRSIIDATVPWQQRDVGRWHAKREELKRFFDATKCPTLPLNAPLVSPPSPNIFMTSEPPSPRGKALSPCASATATRSGSPTSRMESVVDGFMSAVPALMNGANRMRRAASQLHTSIAQRKPHREEVLRDLCAKRGSSSPLHELQPPYVRPPMSALYAVTAKVLFDRGDSVDSPAEWAVCRVSCLEEAAPTQFWIDAVTPAGNDNANRGPSESTCYLPMWLFVGCWRGRVLDDTGSGGDGAAFSVSLEPICSSQFRSPLTFRALRVGFGTYDALERFVTLFRSGQRRTASEWASSQRIEPLL